MPSRSQQDTEAVELEYVSVSHKMVMHEDLNPAGRLFGGRLMEWIDENAALFCMKKMQTRRLVTKKISEVIFNLPADLGDVLDFQFRVRTAGTSSLTVNCRVIATPVSHEEVAKSIVDCDIVFVALDEHGKPSPHNYVCLEKKGSA